MTGEHQPQQEGDARGWRESDHIYRHPAWERELMSFPVEGGGFLAFGPDGEPEVSDGRSLHEPEVLARLGEIAAVHGDPVLTALERIRASMPEGPQGNQPSANSPQAT